MDDKVRIADLLDEIGVHRIEAGMPALSTEDAEVVNGISKKGLVTDDEFRVIVHQVLG